MKIRVCEDKSKYLPPPHSDKIGYSCCGGIIIETQDERIALNNTLDARLDICFHDLKPVIRTMLFPETSKVDLNMQMGQ